MVADRILLPPCVSVVIPVFNRADVFKRAIDSVAAQSFRDFEVIVVDDGSADEPARVAEQAGICRLRLIRHSQNRGAAAARNTGIHIATGRYVAFLDSDDAWHADKLARQVAAMSGAGPTIRACSTGYYLHKGRRISTIRPHSSPIEFRDQILFGCNICPGTTLLVERRTFDEVGTFDEKLRRLEDWDLLLRFVERFDVLLLPDPLATVYSTSGSAHPRTDNEDPVLFAIQHIAAKHAPRLYGRGGLALRKFRSALLFETGAQMFRRHRISQAVGYVLASLWTYPFKNVSYYRSLWQSLVSMLRR